MESTVALDNDGTSAGVGFDDLETFGLEIVGDFFYIGWVSAVLRGEVGVGQMFSRTTFGHCRKILHVLYLRGVFPVQDQRHFHHLFLVCFVE